MYTLVAVNISRLFNSGDGWWTITGKVHPVRVVLSDMIHRVIEGREANIRQRREPAIRGMVFYAASPFKVDGLEYSASAHGNNLSTGFRR